MDKLDRWYVLEHVRLDDVAELCAIVGRPGDVQEEGRLEVVDDWKYPLILCKGRQWPLNTNLLE